MKTLRTLFLLTPALLLGAWISTTTVQAQSRVSINIDGGGGRLHTVVIELDEKNAPKTSANFKKLAADGFYKGIAFHRVVANYLVQVGDPLTKDSKKRNLWGTGGPGYTVPAETGQKHKRGSVAMARLSDGVNPNRASNGSQFYVCLADIPALDGDYTVFGRVVSGLEHLDRISLAAADTNNNPAARIEITGSRVEGDPNAAIASTTQQRPPTPGADAVVTTPDVKAPSTPAPAGAADSTTVAAADTAAAMTKPEPAPAPAPAPAAPTPTAGAQATPGSALAATVADSASRPPAPAPASAALPDTPAATDEVSADLTQPSLSEDLSVDRPEGAPAEPKKKEGFFTRLIKKVW